MNWRAPERQPRPARTATGPKIIVQYRAKGGKVYELQSLDAVVAVRISQRDDAATPSGWHVDAQSKANSGPSVVEGWGTTAAEAFNEVAGAWKAHSPALAVFDWDAIARELHLVQAI